MGHNITANCDTYKSVQKVTDIELNKNPATVTMACGHTIHIDPVMPGVLTSDKRRMRSRQEICKDAEYGYMMDVLKIEILLDIRDLLIKPNDNRGL